MRNGKAAGGVVLALVLAAGAADAQPSPQGGSPAQPAPKYRVTPLNLHREALGIDAFASAGRTRMRNGDCAGALDAFDLALQATTDPTLHRDRGLCHERLGNPYPAIDDYRIYLTADPDAADAEGIRQRLARLEMEVYKHSSASTDSPADAPSSGSSASGSSRSTASAPVSVGTEPRRDAMEYVEHDHDEMTSSLRAGKGFGLAPFFSEHKWLTAGSSFGDSTTWSEAVGLQVRYSVSRSSAFFLEGGWELFNSTDVATISGLTSQLGYELRIPLDYQYDDQLLLGLGLGYEYFVYTPKDASLSGVSGGAFVPRVRLGWRHMLTTSVGLDLSLDAGITGSALESGTLLNGGSQPVELLAANLGVVWGM